MFFVATVIFWAVFGLATFVGFNIKFNQMSNAVHFRLSDDPKTYLKWCAFSMVMGMLMLVLCALVYQMISKEQ